MGEYHREYYKKNKERMLRQSKEWRERNPELWTKINRRNTVKWRTENPEKYVESYKEYNRKKSIRKLEIKNQLADEDNS